MTEELIEKEPEDIMEEQPSRKKLHGRYEWLDQFRGLVILFLIISVVTWPLTGTPSADWIGPPLLNHGFQYLDGWPAMITIIDIGQQIFMFLLGFVGFIAFTSRREKKGTWAAWKHGIIRVAILYAIAFIDDGLFGSGFDFTAIPWDDVLYKGTLANLAIGTFVAYLAVYLVPKNADRRMLIALSLLVVNAVLYFFPIFIRQDLPGGTIAFPFNVLGHAAVAIFGTCYAQWYRMDPKDPKVGFKKRILPASAILIGVFYCFDWIQPAEHHDVNTSLALFAIAAAGFLIAVFYGFEKLKFKVPVLSEMGRNMLFLFIFAFVWDFYVGFLADDYRAFLLAYPVVTMLLCGVLPIAVSAGIAMLFARFKVIIKI